MNPFSKSIQYLRRRLADHLSWDEWSTRSWSQEGEDQILRRIFEQKPHGFYVDVGAHHPMRFSNTYLFYRRGWRGINIDAMPGSMVTFNKKRPRDINLEVGIGLEDKEVDYYIFNEPALNGFSKEISCARDQATSIYHIEKVVKLAVRPLSSVLEGHLPTGQTIDFMSIDVEGLDLEVLQSNDWDRYRPQFVLVEILESSLHEIEGSRIGSLMTGAGYAIYAKCMNTVFFRNER